MSFEDSLRSEMNRAGAALPSTGVDLETVMVEGRRARRRSLIASSVVVAVVVGVGVAGASLVSRDGRSQGPLPPVSSTPPEPTASAGNETVTGDNVEAVLRTWLHAIQDGDEDATWALMTAEAQRIVGRERFNEMMGSALPEGLGAFADATEFSYFRMPTEQVDERLVAVVSGEIQREGGSGLSAMAVPMKFVGGELLVDDPFVGRDRYGDRIAVFASESAGPFPARAGEDLIVEYSTPEGISEAFIAIDDDRVPLPTRFDPETGTARARLDRDLRVGTHIATAVVVHRSGRLYPEAIIFRTAEP